MKKTIELLLSNLTANLTASVERNAEISSEIDKFFLIVMAVVIFFMQCGFAFLEAGSVRYVCKPKLELYPLRQLSKLYVRKTQFSSTLLFKKILS